MCKIKFNCCCFFSFSGLQIFDEYLAAHPHSNFTKNIIAKGDLTILNLTPLEFRTILANEYVEAY